MLFCFRAVRTTQGRAGPAQHTQLDMIYYSSVPRGVLLVDVGPLGHGMVHAAKRDARGEHFLELGTRRQALRVCVPVLPPQLGPGGADASVTCA